MATKHEKIQRQYYTETASQYDGWHVGEAGPHHIALTHMTGFVDKLGISSVLDVGCGTGQGVKYFQDKHPDIRTIGIEPVPAMLKLAAEKGISKDALVCGAGEALPFQDNSFDAVCALGVMHHVKKPDILVREMIRIARKAIFISDNNRFGKGPLLRRLFRVVLCKLGLWNIAYFLKTRGKGCRISIGDGLGYSYSVYDSYNTLSKWTDRITFIPTTETTSKSRYHPMLTTYHLLLCAIKDRQPD